MLSAQNFVSLLVVAIVINILLTSVAYAVMLERKIASWCQDRIGPNRTGFGFGLPFMPKFHFWGLGQPVADGLKLFLKEDYTPPGVEKKLFYLAPFMAIVPALIAWAVIPWGGWWDFPGLTLFGTRIAEPGLAFVTAAPVNIGILYVLAVGSLAVYGIVVAGYASNNKYSFLGGLRATAQMISYEIPMGLVLLIVIVMHGSIEIDTLVFNQTQGLFAWNIFYMPLLAVIFFTCQLAEANRTPFDLAECEQELVGGFHTEYSSMKFALYFLGEYFHIITASAIFTLLFLGAWDIPFIQESLVTGLFGVLIKFAVFAFKTFLVVAAIMVVRWTIPRFRFDQLMKLAWRGLIPVTLVLLLVAAALQYFVTTQDLTPGRALWGMLIANLAVFAGLAILAPLLPKGPPINRRIPLAGSRFSPAAQ